MKVVEVEVEMTGVCRNVIEAVAEGRGGQGGKENLRRAVGELDRKLEVMEKYLRGGGRDYETVRKIKSVVDGMNHGNDYGEGGGRGAGKHPEEEGVEVLRWMAEATRGAEKRKERIGHLI